LIEVSFVSKFEATGLTEGTSTDQAAAPKPTLRLADAIALIVGIVIGAGIFETPSLVADNADSAAMVLLAWLAGGAVSIAGALCYAELSTTYPHVGGNYHFLKRAFGRNLAFLFAWARMAVIQTGSIALLAFIFGDYASQLWRLGSGSSSIYAAIVIILFSVLNIVGLHQGKTMQNALALITVLGLVLVIGVGLLLPAAPAASSTVAPSNGTLGSAMLFVLLSYGGWNEAAYISAEIRDGRRNIVRSLLWSLGIITALYLLINLAYLRGLGLEGMAQSQAVGAELMRRAFGEPGAVLMSLIVIICALSSLNATIFTGARTNYALGQDIFLFRSLGRWQSSGSTPTTALVVQGAIALVLVGLGTITRNGFETMVDYTAPVFWFFFLLSGISLIVLRFQEPHQLRPFRVPYYPITPIVFCGVCAYLLYSSVVYTGVGAIVGIGVVAIGVPLLYWNCKLQKRASGNR
jgi:amino acid transporter